MNIIVPDRDISLGAFVTSYVLAVGVDYKALLDTKTPLTTVTNWDRIKRNYISIEQEQENQSLYDSQNYQDILIKKGTRLEFAVSYLKRNLPKKDTNQIVIPTSYKAFLSDQLAQLLRDPKYVKETQTFFGREQVITDNNDVTVYVWCRALTNPNDNSQQGAWLNISPFVSILQTQVTSQLGSFSINLPFVTCRYDQILGWVAEDVIGFNSGSLRDDVVTNSSLLKYDPKLEGNYLRNRFLFSTIIQESDLIYIRFEKLSIDQELETRLRQVNQEVSGIDIPNRVYDMIALIDRVSESTIPNNVGINIVGRDLMKILIEDGSYFFPEQFAQNIFTNEDSLLTKRNRAELQAQALSAASYTFKSIETILKFIFNKFSNIGWVPNSVFSGYGDKALINKYELKSSILTTSRALEIIDELNQLFAKEDRQGIWRICDFIFDPQAAVRVLADNNISQDNGSIINSIHKICQQPLIEFFGDTYGDKYTFTIRKPPIDKRGYTGLVYDDIVTEHTTDSNTKVGKDDKVKKKQKKKAQQRLQKSDNRPSSLSNLVIDIDESEILSEQLDYHNEAYSWYRIIPRGLGIIDEASAFLLAPVVPFDEYAKVWGNKTFSLEYNYAPTEYLQDSGFKAEAKYAESQAFYDLQFIIQGHQYLPFARTGTITLTGNRTIKRGLFVYKKSTKEVFYVDSVSHSRIFDTNQNVRTTTLRVSRGLREPFIRGKKIRFLTGEKLVSYFSIINTDIQNDASINNKEFLKNWKEDPDIFNFFLQRRQWIDE